MKTRITIVLVIAMVMNCLAASAAGDIYRDAYIYGLLWGINQVGANNPSIPQGEAYLSGNTVIIPYTMVEVAVSDLDDATIQLVKSVSEEELLKYLKAPELIVLMKPFFNYGLDLKVIYYDMNGALICNIIINRQKMGF